jgi:hypothetical protein
MADTEGGGASSVTTVTSQIDAAPTLEACVNLMTTLCTMMQTDAQLSGPLETAGIMWNSSADAVNTAHLELHSVTETLLQDWHSEDSKDFVAARAVTETSLSTSYDAMVPVPGVLNALAGQIRTTASTVETQRAELNKVVDEYNDLKAQGMGKVLDEYAEVWAQKGRVPLRAAGDAMIGLAGKFSLAGGLLTTDAGNLKWEGPGSGNAAPTTSAPSNVPSTPSSPGGPTGADPAATDPAATDPGGQQAGPADQGGGAQDAGAGGMDGAGGSDGAGSIPQAPAGGTGLAGMPAGSTALFPKEPMLPNVPMANTPVTSPMNTLPVDAVPGGFTGGAGAGKIPGGGVGGGGGGLPGVGSAGGGHQKGVGSKLPGAVAETATSPGPLSGGRAPAAASGLASGTGAATGASGGGMPPMMPPMTGGAAGAGSNKAGKPGNGVISRANRRRDRQQGDTPGVPAGLRGREGKDLPGAFPAVPVNTRRRKEKTEAANTLQLLDEDLWKVDATEAKAPPPQNHRPTN